MHDNSEKMRLAGATRCAGYVAGIPLARQGWAPIPQDVSVSFTVRSIKPPPRDLSEFRPC